MATNTFDPVPLHDASDSHVSGVADDRLVRPALTRQEIEDGALIHFGIWLREQRRKSSLTLEDVAQDLGPSASKSTVQRWETGKSEPSITEIMAMTRILSITVDEILAEVSRSRDIANETRPQPAA